MGHMKATRQGICSTKKNNKDKIDDDDVTVKTSNTSGDNNNNNDNNNDSEEDEDDDKVLEPPRLHLKRAINHQVACTVIATKDLNGTICTNLPGRFPFTSDLLNNYIFVMYDFDSNNIIAKPIKSRNKDELVRDSNYAIRNYRKRI